LSLVLLNYIYCVLAQDKLALITFYLLTFAPTICYQLGESNQFLININMNQEKDLINEELAHLGELPEITPEVLKLDACRVHSKSDIPEEQFLFKHLGRPCFPRKDLSAITGPAKSGKTFFISMVMAAGFKPQVMTLERIRKEPLKVLWFDTEQSESTTKDILLNRIQKMIGSEEFPDEYFFAFNVRSLSPDERREMLLLAINTYHPDFVIIDGIADLLQDINDGPRATELMEQLLISAKENDCNIVLLIHLNRTGEKGNLRGWLGTLVLQKSYEVFNCAAVPQSETLSVELSFSRKYRNGQTLYYDVDDAGIPYISKRPNIPSRDLKEKSFMQEENEGAFNHAYIIDDPEGIKPWIWNLNKLFADGLGSAATLGFDQIKDRVMKLANIKQLQYYYRVCNEAAAKGIIVKTYDKCGRVVISMPSQ